MASVTYGKCNLRQVRLMASVTYGEGIMAKVLLRMKLSPKMRYFYPYTKKEMRRTYEIFFSGCTLGGKTTSPALHYRG